MSKPNVRMWTFGALVGILAAGDWFIAPAPAGPDGETPSLEFGKAKLTIAMREVEVKGAKERHAFLEIAGDATGTVKVELQEQKGEPQSRMMPAPRTVWRKDVAIDTAKGRSIDLGGCPRPRLGALTAILASEDGQRWVALHAEVGIE